MSKYLLFSVLSETYGLPIEKVREIIRFESITPIHDALDYIKGVINLRGKIIPIFDMKLKFGMPRNEYNDHTVFIIVDIAGQNGEYNIGLAVDAVHEVSDISEEMVKETPEMGLKVRSKYLKGIARSNDTLVMLLNIDEIIKEDSVLSLAEELND